MWAPVNRLPSEIISYIARCVPDDHAINTRQIVPLTHVCQYWRDSIISAPDNWALISNKPEGLAVLSLERSKLAPLSICLTLHQLFSARDPGFPELLLSHIQRTRSLSISGFYTAKELTQALPNFPKSMPNLRSLMLTKYWGVDPTPSPLDFSAHTIDNLSLRNVSLFPSFLTLRTLTELTIGDQHFALHLDTLLDFVEENRSLESASFGIKFLQPSLQHSRRQTPIGNQIQHLSVSCYDAIVGRALISSIALRRGGSLEIHYSAENEELVDLFSGVSTTHLPNLSFPTFMEYRSSSPMSLRLFGPNGSFSLGGYFSSENPFKDFLLSDFDAIRNYSAASIPTELHPSSFPSLEVLVVNCGTDVSQALSLLLPNPASSPSLKILALLGCVITEGFMDRLTQFASDRANTTSASLQRVVIIDSNREFPSVTSIERLRKHVPVVEVMEGCRLPMDLHDGGLAV